MAYVPISDRLLSEVRTKLNHLRNVEFESIRTSHNLIASACKNQRVITAAQDKLWEPFSEVRHLIDRPPMAREMNTNVSVKMSFATTDHNTGETSDVDRSVTLGLGKISVPAFARKAESYYEEAATVQLSVENVPEVFGPIRDAVATEFEVSARWAAVTEQVYGFLQSCKSLNEAVKLWPDVRRYISDEYLARLDQKTARQSADDARKNAALEALKGVNVDMVTSSTVLARMAAGNNG